MIRPRVLVADDHRETRLLWVELLAVECEIVGQVADGASFLDAACRLRPDVAVIDITMPILDGVTAAERLLRSDPDSRVVLATVHTSPALVRRALAAGVLGYVLKVSAGEDLLPAVRAALRGEQFVSEMPAPRSNRANP